MLVILLAMSTTELFARYARQAEQGPVMNFTTEHFTGSGACARCHNGLTDSTGADVSLQTSWSGSVMRFAFIDPLWRAKVRTEVLRAPNLQNIVEDKCGRCHAPMANVEAKFANEPAALFGSGFLSLDNPYHEAAMEGISCALCHQILDSPDLGTDNANSGRFFIGDLSPPQRPLFGPYVDVFTRNMKKAVGYTPTFSSHISESSVCAVCHDLKTPYVDAAGEVVSTSGTEFPEQMPYREWSLSSYATEGPGASSCQGCHMPSTDGVKISRSPRWLPKRNGFSQHQFRTGNSLLLELIDNNEMILGLRPLDLEKERADCEQFLSSAAALEMVRSSLSQGTLDFTVKVSNLTGHKLSTGIPIRRIILHVTVTNPLGQVVFESGKVNDDMSVQGCDADLDPFGFEPHYDLITSPDQVQIYEGIMGNTDGEVTYTLLRASHFLKDNRLLPAGFDKAAAPLDVAPAATALDDTDFIGGSDQVSYRVEGLGSGSHTVTIQLLEQKVSFAFLRDLLQDEEDEEVTAYGGMLQQTPSSFRPLADLSMNIDGL
jgi:hypothetical protein